MSQAIRSAFGRGDGALGLLLALLLVVGLAPAIAAGESGGGQPPTAGGPTSTAGTDGRGNAYQITLITGDVAVLQVTSDGHQAAWVEKPAPGAAAGAPAQVYEQDGQVHVVPAEAAPYLAADVLDDKLFNLTLLSRYGYHDAARSDLPLLLAASEGAPGARAARTPRVPAGAELVRELPAVDTVSVVADKSDVRSVWESIRGSRVARESSADARLAGAGKVWLNGRVEATLDESVAQIGAAQAWASGYDGTGVSVAVLDTGYDAGHPDLAGRVSAARDFTAVDAPGAVARDGQGHGTHVTATVGGSGAGSGGTRKGVAPGADLIVGKVLDDNGGGYDDEIIAGMTWAVDQGAEVVSMSLGSNWASDGTDPLSQAVNSLTESSGALFVVAAGNAGPAEGTVSAPGAADQALTVGAVTKDDEAAWFSSRGPRAGDGAIKPEITAPGVGIVAARAAGTSLGNLLDERYTSMNGTSMATPHVAGAAAILAQQHPSWDADELKARLVTTSKVLDGEPITLQGGGRVDVAAATRDSLTVDAASLSLGRIAQSAAPVSRTLTYRNPSDRPLKLHVSADVSGTGSDERQEPALRLSDSTLTVPAHGAVQAKVTLEPGGTEAGGYAGLVRARAPGKTELQTPVAFTVGGPLRTVTVHALDRDGQGASGPVDLWSAETGDLVRRFLTNGIATFQVPEGMYSLVAGVEAAGSWFASTVHTIAGQPELLVEQDVTLRYDARDAERLRVTTPKKADLDRFDVIWSRSVGDRSVSMISFQGTYGEEVYVLESPRVRTGSFTLVDQWQFAQPLVTARLTGPDGFVTETPQLASAPRAFVGAETLPLVDAGQGTPEEFAAADAAGAVALVGRRGEQWGELAKQAQAAAAAGAKVLLAYNTSPKTWTETVWQSPLPVYRVEGDTGAALLEALAADPDRALDLVGVQDATYQYDLAFAEDRGIPDGQNRSVREADVAAVVSDYRQNSARMMRGEAWIPYVDSVGVGNSMSKRRNGPLKRTDYVSTDGVRWQRFAQPHEFLGLYWTASAVEQYTAGRSYQQLWWGPLVRPGIPATPGLEDLGRPVARFRDAIRVHMPHYLFDGSVNSTIYEQMGDRSELTLEREGEVVGKSTWPQKQFTVPAGDAEYALRLDVVNGDRNWSDTSVRTSTEWRFRSARTDEPRTVLPLVQVGYGLNANAYNEMPSGSSYPLELRPGYQPGGAGPGRFTATVDVSFDDGETWQNAPVTSGAAAGSMQAMIPATAGPGFATVRLVVTDASGNRLDQRIDRAWKVAKP